MLEVGRTRAVFVEFGGFNANRNLFSVNWFLFEKPGTGTFHNSFRLPTP